MNQRRCTSCGTDLTSCTCPLTFAVYTDLAKSVGIEEGASRLAMFFLLPTSAQLDCWRSVKDEPR